MRRRIAFLSVLPLAALPLMQEESLADDSGASGSGGEGPQQISSNGGDLMIVDPIDPDAGLPTSADGSTYRFDVSPGDMLINDFERGTDIAQLDLSSVLGEIVFDTGTTEEGAVVSFSIGPESVTTLTFSGLNEVPADDVILRLTDDETGQPYDLSLTDAIADSVVDYLDTMETLDPLDPNVPDDPGPVTGNDPITDPAIADDAGPDVTDPSILDPLDPDEEYLGIKNHSTLGHPLTSANLNPDEYADWIDSDLDADLTIGGEDDDALELEMPGWIDHTLMNVSDVSGENNESDDGREHRELFWLYPEGADTINVADVPDFRVGEDFLRVSLNPNMVATETPDVSVTPSMDGADGLVTIDGNLMAILRGAANATALDVYAEVRTDLFI